MEYWEARWGQYFLNGGPLLCSGGPWVIITMFQIVSTPICYTFSESHGHALWHGAILDGSRYLKNWETGVSICLVFIDFSKELLTSHCENTESESLDPSIESMISHYLSYETLLYDFFTRVKRSLWYFFYIRSGPAGILKVPNFSFHNGFKGRPGPQIWIVGETVVFKLDTKNWFFNTSNWKLIN